ncbi:hypothetical protein CLOHYLEM_04451 [[Clostridium] hylemonae DSM 15053]|uniref:Uncharacterized protein n=1 Tax=[Clostridium] hylemonae DSM 15053 TaxID=553973 RepID=C0BXB4_9FIRM|nr:hypothetical protein CLOHYLEM_04451 [[Clostridium] hylemonae DSM 15053]
MILNNFTVWAGNLVAASRLFQFPGGNLRFDGDSGTGANLRMV